MKNIYLVGFMGTGKTSVGKELAKKLEWPFADLDDLIELKERRLIRDIFAKNGEAYFRKVEGTVLKQVAKEKKFVVSCGGGIVIDPANITLMKKSGTIICLTASPEIIFKRTSRYAHRPLLNVPNPKKHIEVLLKMRAPYYAKAHKVIDTSKFSVKQAAGKILKTINNKK